MEANLSFYQPAKSEKVDIQELIIKGFALGSEFLPPVKSINPNKMYLLFAVEYFCIDENTEYPSDHTLLLTCEYNIRIIIDRIIIANLDGNDIKVALIYGVVQNINGISKYISSKMVNNGFTLDDMSRVST
jgi:hypothetical protein